MKKILFILLLLITSPLVANPAHIQITKLSDSKRNQLFTDFMKNSGESCVVTRNFIQGTKKNGDAYWNIACKNEKSYVIEIKNNKTGSTNILNCEVYNLSTKLKCFNKF